MVVAVASDSVEVTMQRFHPCPPSFPRGETRLDTGGHASPDSCPYASLKALSESR
jgi:hypothetical protein